VVFGVGFVIVGEGVVLCNSIDDLGDFVVFGVGFAIVGEGVILCNSIDDLGDFAVLGVGVVIRTDNCFVGLTIVVVVDFLSIDGDFLGGFGEVGGDFKVLGVELRVE